MKNNTEIKFGKNESISWVFTLVRDHKKGKWTVYAGNVKSYTTDAETAPEAMLEYFQNWDSDEVVI